MWVKAKWTGTGQEILLNLQEMVYIMPSPTTLYATDSLGRGYVLADSDIERKYKNLQNAFYRGTYNNVIFNLDTDDIERL